LADGPARRESETGSAAFLLAALAWANIGYAATWHTTLMNPVRHKGPGR
jgi:hypothetical protein